MRRVESEHNVAVTVLLDDSDAGVLRQALLAVLVHQVIERQQERVPSRRDVAQRQLTHHHAGEQHLQLPALRRVPVLDGIAEVVGRGHRIGPAVLGDVFLADEPSNCALDVLVGDLRQLTRLLGGDVAAVVAHERRPVPATGSLRRRHDEGGGAFGARELADPVGRPMQERERRGILVGDAAAGRRLDGVCCQPPTRQGFARQRKVGPRLYAQHVLHPQEMLAILGDQPVQRRADPLRSA